jgi:hypothetical protein
MRHDQNAVDVIYRVKQRIREIEPGLPRGLKITPICDRSDAGRELPTSEVPDESGRVFLCWQKAERKARTRSIGFSKGNYGGFRSRAINECALFNSLRKSRRA